MKNTILISMLFSFVNFAHAGNSVGKVTHLMVHTGDIVMFSSGLHTNKPSCSTVDEHWALSLKTEKGKSMYALLLSSAAQGLTVNVTGEQACNAWGDRESPMYMSVNY